MTKIKLEGFGEQAGRTGGFQTWEELKKGGVSASHLIMGATPEMRAAFYIFGECERGSITADQKSQLEELCKAGRMEEALRILRGGNVERDLKDLQSHGPSTSQNKIG